MTVALPELRVGDPLRHESLSVFPLFSNSVGEVDYRLSEPALADESLLVEEVDEGGSVPDLLVENKGDIRVTEAEWLVSNDPWQMVHVVERSKPPERKVRLLNSAVCRRFWHYLPDELKAILSESELLADRAIPVPHGGMDLCHRANVVVGRIDQQYPAKQFPTPELRTQRDAAAAVCYAVVPNDLWGAIAYCWELDPTEKEPHAVIIRDVFGNPFRHIKITSSWLTPAVRKIAQAIYDECAFDRMPVLADTLEQVGCDDAEILNHCRSDEQHVRGCWVIDKLLGKS